MTLRQLPFDAFCTPFAGEYLLVMGWLVKIFDSVLLLHWGPKEKFEVLLEMDPDAGATDCWILCLSNSRISLTDLNLQFHDNKDGYGTEDLFEVPSCLFHCRDLVKLELHYCSLKLPCAF